ncbi:hypothetical protein MYY11_002797 [Enterococcus faecium]|nr:hypothetical protein [Enterococcus faecium]
MKNKDIYLEILKLTNKPEWMNDPEIVCQVQSLSKKISIFLNKIVLSQYFSSNQERKKYITDKS